MNLDDYLLGSSEQVSRDDINHTDRGVEENKISPVLSRRNLQKSYTKDKSSDYLNQKIVSNQLLLPPKIAPSASGGKAKQPKKMGTLGIVQQK